MSGPLALALAAAGAPSVATTAPAPDIYTHAISVALPSLDTGRGIAANYELWMPQQRKLSLVFSAELRESATGDYTGIRIGGGVEARWYWRGDRDAWLSRVPAGNMVGWFLGGGAYVATDFTHDSADSRWLGTALQLGIAGRVGYRIAPWRQLAITPSAGLEVHEDFDVSGRLPPFTRGGLALGVDAGWLF